MKIESKKLVGVLAFVVSTFVMATSAFANPYYNIVPNEQNPYFFTSSAYAANYYKTLGYYTYENNPAAACYGMRSCYSANYYYPTYGYNNYNYGYNNYGYNYNSYVPNTYATNSYTYNPYVSNSVQPDTYNSYNSYSPYYNYYTYSNPLSVASVPQYFWAN